LIQLCTMTKMVTCEELAQELLEALTHLYDPDYQPPGALCALIGCDPREGALTFQTAIIHVIESLEPSPNAPPAAHIRRVYEVLHNRYVLKLTQDETTDRLHLSRSSVQRAQREAAHVLAGVLWERYQAPGPVSRGEPEKKEEGVPDVQAPDWRSQMQRELASLRAKAPDAVSDVGEVISSALECVNTLTSELGLCVEVRSVQPGLVAAVHPVVLQQILISALKRLVRYVSNGRIAIYARLEDGNAKITLAGTLATGSELGETDLIKDIPVSADISIEICIDGAQAFVWIEAPSVGKVTVLVVDDNEDMVRFYQSSALGTRYHIVHTAQGQGLLETIEATTPDAIVLDVMLPDIDGWRLLMRLHEDPATRPIPVVVCSVLREEDLALSLGAAYYLPKPVRPREFIRTLDQVLAQAAAATLTSPASNEEAC
jgi:CheY-like chemotaxis protein